jgi:hypothetical protein
VDVSGRPTMGRLFALPAGGLVPGDAVMGDG